MKEYQAIKTDYLAIVKAAEILRANPPNNLPLWAATAPSVNMIAAQLGRHPVVISRRVNEMEKRGMVIRLPAPGWPPLEDLVYIRSQERWRAS